MREPWVQSQASHDPLNTHWVWTAPKVYNVYENVKDIGSRGSTQKPVSIYRVTMNWSLIASKRMKILKNTLNQKCVRCTIGYKISLKTWREAKINWKIFFCIPRLWRYQKPPYLFTYSTQRDNPIFPLCRNCHSFPLKLMRKIRKPKWVEIVLKKNHIWEHTVLDKRPVSSATVIEAARNQCVKTDVPVDRTELRTQK